MGKFSSKSKNKKSRNRTKKQSNQITNPKSSKNQSHYQHDKVVKKSKKKKKRTLNDFVSRLNGSSFRLLNEKLYTTDPQSSFNYFNKHPDNFTLVRNILRRLDYLKILVITSK